MNSKFTIDGRTIKKIVIKLELHRRFKGSVNAQIVPMELSDYYVYLYGFFQDQLAFAHAGFIHIDCHTGNQLVSLRGNETVFNWSDFGYSISGSQQNVSQTESEMYLAPSANMFRFISRSAQAIGNAALNRDIRHIKQLHLKSNKTNSIDYFFGMASSVQKIVNNLTYPLWLNVVKRTGSASIGTIEHLDTRVTNLQKLNDQQQKDIDQQQKVNDQQQKDIDQQKEVNDQQKEDIVQLQKANDQLQKNIAQLTLDISGLIKRLGPPTDATVT